MCIDWVGVCTPSVLHSAQFVLHCFSPSDRLSLLSAPVCPVCLRLPLSVCGLSVCHPWLSLSHNSHPSYTAAQPVEERWARCQPAGAPVGQSISSTKDMLSTRVYPPGLEPWSPVPAPPCCPSTHSGALGKVHRVPFLLYQHGTQSSSLLL